MGLTIHYDLKSTTRSAARARELVDEMRRLAMDLPFEEVSEVVELSGEECDHDQRDKNDPWRWLLIQSRESVALPWNKNCSVDVLPLRVIAFSVWPGKGCEDVNIGLCQYLADVVAEYRPEEDERFHRDGCFSYTKFRNWVDRKFPGKFVTEDDLAERRTIKLRKGGWRWGSFCKTQYASDPSCGGLPNFLRCHISTVTLLERIGELPTINIQVQDEGQYGPSYYSDDWQEARAEGREPTYTWHPGRYNVKELAKELGEWNEMIAAQFGAMKDAVGDGLVGPIQNFQNFEQLEFHGSQNPGVKPFLEAMAELAKRST